MRKFTVYWRFNDFTHITGECIEDAFRRAGYGGGAIAAVDFFTNDHLPRYKWNDETKRWDRQPLLGLR